MKCRLSTLVALTLSASLATSCATRSGSPQEQANRSCGLFGPKQTIGILGGAAAGAGLGAAASGGKNATGAVLIGALIGAIGGALVGGSLDQQDCEQARLALKQMDTAPVGQKIAWSNPNSGNSGTFTALSDASKEADGKVCRQYQRDMILKDGQHTGGDVGTVCRDANGDWDVIN